MSIGFRWGVIHGNVRREKRENGCALLAFLDTHFINFIAAVIVIALSFFFMLYMYIGIQWKITQRRLLIIQLTIKFMN